jgi:hypothetical protein
MIPEFSMRAERIRCDKPIHHQRAEALKTEEVPVALSTCYHAIVQFECMYGEAVRVWSCACGELDPSHLI